MLVIISLLSMHSRFPSPSASTSPGLGSLPGSVTRMFIPGLGNPGHHALLRLLLLPDVSLPSELGRGMPRDTLVDRQCANLFSHAPLQKGRPS